MTDIEIARAAKLKHIAEVAATLGVRPDNVEYYGRYKAKIDYTQYAATPRKGKLILVTAMTPTPYGEGKTTTSIGLADGIAKLGKNACLALREPSLGPVFGLKGGATGGGKAQIAPMEDINLHFTGDIHAIESANNLLCAMVDNHIFQGNKLGFNTVEIRRCMDMNDRQLRHIESGLGGEKNGVPRADGFDITVASEVMACFCLATSLEDLKDRLGEIIVGRRKNGSVICAKQLGAAGAMAALLKDALKPNLVQTLEGTPALVHGGPFANIAHGCNSVIATDLALKLSDYVVTEAGFGADLGAEKFLDIKCPILGQNPSVIALVVTSRAIKHMGFENVERHYENLNSYGIPVVVVVNKFKDDDENSIGILKKSLTDKNIAFCLSDAWAAGGDGCLDAAAMLVEKCNKITPRRVFSRPYHINYSLEDKIEALARKVYGAEAVEYSPEAKKKILQYNNCELPICVAKTQYSISDNPELRGAPSNFALQVKDIKYCAGAKFVVIYCGNIMTMPGLPPHPAAEYINIKDNGDITGIF